jgi:4-carboxymuconolactone decarboxylase
MGDLIQRLGTQIRFNSSLPARLNEFAILITAQYWGAQYEWFAHHRLALKAGLSEAVADQLLKKERPIGMSEDESVVYDFSTELHNTHFVSDNTYAQALKLFGERGIMDLIAVNGYYDLVSMTLNVDRTPVPKH